MTVVLELSCLISETIKAACWTVYQVREDLTPRLNQNIYFMMIKLVMFQHGNIICGGDSEEAGQTCVNLSDGFWNVSHQLERRRRDHTNWMTSSGLILMGGYWSGQTTDLLLNNGSTQERFNLKHQSRCVKKIILTYLSVSLFQSLLCNWWRYKFSLNRRDLLQQNNLQIQPFRTFTRSWQPQYWAS